jgi:hypothetical protein
LRWFFLIAPSDAIFLSDRFALDTGGTTLALQHLATLVRLHVPLVSGPACKCGVVQCSIVHEFAQPQYGRCSGGGEAVMNPADSAAGAGPAAPGRTPPGQAAGLLHRLLRTQADAAPVRFAPADMHLICRVGPVAGQTG